MILTLKLCLRRRLSKIQTKKTAANLQKSQVKRAAVAIEAGAATGKDHRVIIDREVAIENEAPETEAGTEVIDDLEIVGVVHEKENHEIEEVVHFLVKEERNLDYQKSQLCPKKGLQARQTEMQELYSACNYHNGSDQET